MLDLLFAEFVGVLARIEALTWVLVVLGWAIMVGVTASVAEAKKRDSSGWAAGAMFLGPLILLIVSLLSPNVRYVAKTNEELKAAAPERIRIRSDQRESTDSSATAAIVLVAVLIGGALIAINLLR